MPAKRTRSAASNAKPATPKPSATKAAPKTKAAAKAKSAAKPKPAATARPTRNAAPKVAAAAAAKPRATAAARTTARAAATAASASKAPAKAKASKTAPKPAPVKKAPAAKKPKTAAEAAPATPAPIAVATAVTTATSAKKQATTASTAGSAELFQIALSFDTTGSMHPCLEVVKTSIIETVRRLRSAIPKIQISIIAHGDYQDAPATYDVTYLDFTTDDKLLCDFVKKVQRTCGYDSDECYEYAIYKARTELSWKADANKTLVVIGDASPHEPSYSLNKLKIDWRVEAAKLKDANIKVYAVKCLNWGTESFYRELARITNGHYLELHQLQAITNFMIAISLKEGTAVDQLLAYREEVRTKGQLTRNMRQLFTTLGAVVPGEVAAEEPDLDAVDPCRFQVLDVTEKTSIKDFVQKMGAAFKAGKGFYEYTKAEEVQGYKEIVLMNKNTGDMYTGACARRLAGIEDHTPGKKAKPPSSEKWIMFVQSTSYNRALMPGTKFLYEADNV